MQPLYVQMARVPAVNLKAQNCAAATGEQKNLIERGKIYWLFSENVIVMAVKYLHVSLQQNECHSCKLILSPWYCEQNFKNLLW